MVEETKTFIPSLSSPVLIVALIQKENHVWVAQYVGVSV